MKVYKLKYSDKDNAIVDLLSKGIYVMNSDNELIFGEGVHAIIEIGKIPETFGEYDSNFNVIVEPTYKEGYLYDIMYEQTIDFGSIEIFPTTPNHTFAGWEN